MKYKKSFIGAEIGVNHNGNDEGAKAMIDKAVWAGADAVKFQTFKADKPVAQTAPNPPDSKNLGLWVTLRSGPGASK